MVLFGALAFTARVQSGCSSETTPVSPAPDAEVPVDSAPRDAGTKDAKVPPIPGELEGWVTWNDYDPKCGFQVPSDRKYLPEPFEWEPCQDTEVTRKLACRRIKKKWEGYRGEFISPATEIFTRDDGTQILATIRYWRDHALYLFAEVDGPTKVAVYGTLDRECLITGHSGNGSRYVFQVAERDDQGKWATLPAGIGGHVDELVPKVLLRKPYAIAHTLVAGNAGLIDHSGRLEVYSWTDPPTLVRTIQGGGAYSFVKMHDDFFFWASDAPAATERIWTPEGGDQLLMGVASDLSRGAADLNTDGKDWVWGEGEGRTNAGYPIVKIVTAPFTRDPSKLQKRILRNDLGNGAFATVPFAVGHGYAGHLSSRPDSLLGSMVVRLSDAAAWFIPGRPASPIDFQDVLAFSKDEVFILVRDENGTNVYRVRLDSLGTFALPPAPN